MARRVPSLLPAVVATLVAGAPLSAQSARVTLATCPAADSALGPPHDEAGAPVTGSYSAKSDSTSLQVFAGYSDDVGVFTRIVTSGAGPSTPLGTALSFLFVGDAATRRSRARGALPVTLFLADSLTLALGPARPLPLVTSGDQPGLTINVILTRAAFRSLVLSPTARFSWPGTSISLWPKQLNVLRALYRAALCAPTGMPVAS